MFLKEARTSQSTTANVDSANPEFSSIVSGMWRYANANRLSSAAAVIPAELLPALAENDQTVILVVLPAVAEDKVLGALNGEVDVFNCISEDLLESVTTLSLGNPDAELRLETGALLSHALNYEDESFVIVVACGESVFRRRFVPVDGDEFLVVLQGAEASSGCNYRPHRIYTAEELQEAALRAQEAETATFDGKVFAPAPLNFNFRRKDELQESGCDSR